MAVMLTSLQDSELIQLLIPRILHLFHMRNQPIFLGDVSSWLGYGIHYTQIAINRLVDDKVLRPATTDEIRAMSDVADANIYVLAVPVNLAIAFQS